MAFPVIRATIVLATVITTIITTIITTMIPTEREEKVHVKRQQILVVAKRGMFMNR